jgi:hypothetical protein
VLTGRTIVTTEDYSIELERVIDLANYIHFHDQAGSIAFAMPHKSARSKPEPAQVIINVSDLHLASKEVLEGIPGIKKRICAALASATDDLKSITNVVFGVLFPLKVGGQLTLPITPLVIASISVMIFSAGVKYFCAGLLDL